MARKDKLIRTTALVTVVIILSKMFGLMRDVITAGYFGTGVENDAYASAYTLFYFPVLLFNSCITATIVPLFVEEREKYSLKHSNHFASNALNLFILAALIIAAVTFVICMTGLEIGKRVGTRLANKAGILGGVILLFIGLEIFISSWF